MVNEVEAIVDTQSKAAVPARYLSVRRSLMLAGIAAVLWLGLRLLSTWHIPPRAPDIPDEFCYLLGADTFLHGRLTNPTPAMARFFESPMLLITPTYASKYPPGESAWLALGKLLFGSTYAGLILQGFCLVFVLALTFCVWANYRIAALITFVAGICLLPPVSTWTHWYFGAGCATAIGAACVLLGLGLFIRMAKPGWGGLLMAFGAVQLSLNRPYEGAVFCLVTFALTPWLARRNGLGSRDLLKVAAWAAPVLLLGVGVNCVYNKAVTGNALQIPYLLHSKQYDTATPFCFVPPRRPDPKYDNLRLAATHGWNGFEGKSYRDTCAPRLWFAYTFVDTAVALFLLLCPVVPILLLLPLSWRAPASRALLIIVAVAFISNGIEVWRNTHYLAVLFVAILVLCACILHDSAEVRTLSPSAKRGLAASLAVLTLAFFIYSERERPPIEKRPFPLQRAAIVKQLSALPREQLVVVHYPDPYACNGEEWVYNGADPDHDKIVWAQDLGQAQDASLFSYYRGRQKWLLTAKCSDIHFSPLPDNATAALAAMQAGIGAASR